MAGKADINIYRNIIGIYVYLACHFYIIARKIFKLQIIETKLWHIIGGVKSCSIIV